jgi:hypothetical protein
MALPRLVLVPPTVLDVVAHQGGIAPRSPASFPLGGLTRPYSVLAEAAAMWHEAGSNEVMMTVLDALVPLDLRAMHGRPFGLRTLPSGKEHTFATLIGAYAIVGLELCGAAKDVEDGRAILAHVIGRLTEHHGPAAQVVDKRLEEAGIVGGLPYLRRLAEATAVTSLETQASTIAQRLELADHWDLMLTRPLDASAPDLTAYMETRRAALRTSMALSTMATTMENQQWARALTCALFVKDAAMGDNVVRAAHRATPSVNLYHAIAASPSPPPWPSMRRLIVDVAAIGSVPPLTIPPASKPSMALSAKVETMRARIIHAVHASAQGRERPPHAPPPWSLSYALVLYGRWTAAGATVAAGTRDELRRLLVTHGVDAADLDFSEKDAVRVPLATMVEPPPRNVLGAIVKFFTPAATAAPTPTPAPQPAPALEVEPPPMDMMARLLGNSRRVERK